MRGLMDATGALAPTDHQCDNGARTHQYPTANKILDSTWTTEITGRISKCDQRKTTHGDLRSTPRRDCIVSVVPALATTPPPKAVPGARDISDIAVVDPRRSGRILVPPLPCGGTTFP